MAPSQDIEDALVQRAWLRRPRRWYAARRDVKLVLFMRITRYDEGRGEDGPLRFLHAVAAAIPLSPFHFILINFSIQVSRGDVAVNEKSTFPDKFII